MTDETNASQDRPDQKKNPTKDIVYEGGFSGGGGGTGVLLGNGQWVLYNMIYFNPNYQGFNELEYNDHHFKKVPFDLPKKNSVLVETEQGSYTQFQLPELFDPYDKSNMDRYPAYSIALQILDELKKADISGIFLETYIKINLSSRNFAFVDRDVPFPLDSRFEENLTEELKNQFRKAETMAFQQQIEKPKMNKMQVGDQDFIIIESDQERQKRFGKIKTFFNLRAVDRLDLLSQVTILLHEFLRNYQLNWSPIRDNTFDVNLYLSTAILTQCQLSSVVWLPLDAKKTMGVERTYGRIALGLLHENNMAMKGAIVPFLFENCKKKDFLGGN
ncbi:MAG: hypothetical protein KDD50_10035 [Bdellovibrionales bacterium]|nr:hypothetical protein [Bdellovibrionales bacterium]